MSVLNYLYFAKEFIRFKFLMKRNKRFPLYWRDRYPCLTDKTQKTWFDRHYVYHAAWAARILAQKNPAEHVDISSTVYFCSLVSAFIPVKYYDYRPADLKLSNLSVDTADLLSLTFGDGSVESLSCMHVVEHVGLGRYGDILDPDGDLKAIVELKRILANGGTLLFVVPVGGVSKVMFNAHRVYCYDQIMDYFSDLSLEGFALITDSADDGGFVEYASKEMADAQQYGCGCFCFTKVKK